MNVWKVWSFNWESATAQLINFLVRLKADITVVQVLRWTAQKQKCVGSGEVDYNGHINVMGEGFSHRVLVFTPVDEQLDTIRIHQREVRYHITDSRTRPDGREGRCDQRCFLKNSGTYL